MTTRPRGRIVVCDGCIDRVGAHPWAYASALFAAARRSGWDCDILSHRRFRPPDGFEAPGHVHPLLRRHGATRLTAFAELERLPADAPGRRRWPCEAWARAAARRRRVSGFAADIAPVIADLAPGDHFLVATASELDASGLARALAAVRPRAGIGWHLLFHAPLLAAGAGPDDGPDARVARVRRLLDRAIAAALPHTLRFHATTEELAAEWLWAGAAGIGVLPYPVSSASIPAGADALHGPLRIALLGDARPEKNSHLVAPLARWLGDEASLAARVHLAVQTNPGFPPHSRHPADMAVAAALREIAGRRDAILEDLGGPLDAAAFRAEVDRADGLLLPYDARRYRHRLSALLLEALAAGKVPLVTPGGWMARRLLPALRTHVDALVAAHATLGVQRAAAAAVGAGEARSLPLHPPEGADVAVVEADWSRRERSRPDAAPRPGDLPFDTPLKVTLAPGAEPAGAVLAHPLDDRGTPALFRLRTPPRRAVVEAPESGGGGVDVTLSVRWLRCGVEPPLGGAGIVMRGPDAAGESLRELADHRDHYLATARRGAAAVAVAHAPEEVLRTLVS